MLKKKGVFLPYDFDSSLGINNEGKLTFSYNLEDIDTVDGSPVFNGQNSALWQNFRATFADEIREMYFNTRRDKLVFSFNGVENRFQVHQSKWSEAIFNEDAYFKYLQPYLTSNESSNDATTAAAATAAAEAQEEAGTGVSTKKYLPMVQGSKAQQRKWWLYNRFKYLDSKYNAGDALTDYIDFRAYAKGDITVTPYADIYATVAYGSYQVQKRAQRNVPITLECPASNLNDTETQIFSAGQLSDVGDLSALKVDSADFSRGVKLQKLKLGSNAQGYQNEALKDLSLGNLPLLTEIDLRNCINLRKPIDLSGSLNLKKAYFDNTKLTSVTFPEGGFINIIHLPNTITSLVLKEQKQITDFQLDTTTIDGESGKYLISQLYLQNVEGVPVESILANSPNLARVRLVNVEWTSTSEAILTTIYNKLITCKNLTDDTAPIINGRINVSDISEQLLVNFHTNLPNLTIVKNGNPMYLVRWIDGDATTVLASEVVAEGDAVTTTNPTLSKQPTKQASDDSTRYVFNHWDTPSAASNVQSNLNIYGVYDTSYRVILKNGDNSDLLVNPAYVVSGQTYTYSGSAPTKASTVGETFTWNNSSGWRTNSNYSTTSNNDSAVVTHNNTFTVTAPMTLWPNFTVAVRQYTVSFTSEGNNSITPFSADYDSILNTTVNDPTHSGTAAEWRFDGWFTEGNVQYVRGTTRVTGNMVFIAKWTDMSSIVVKYLQGTLTTYETTATSPIAEYGLSSQSNLTKVITSASSINNNAFISSNNLTSLVLTRTDTITTLTSSAVLSNCKIGKGTGGIYVPRSMVSTYKAASNWSTYASQIVAIEDYPNYDCTDFTILKNYTWNQIINAGATGQIGEGTDFVVGATKNLPLTNGTNVEMQLVAINGDVLSSDHTSTAQMTWLCKNIYSKSEMGASNSQISWEDGAATMKSILSTIYELIPDSGDNVVKSYIVPVDKITYGFDSNRTARQETTSETIWIPSYREVMMGTDKETTGVQYNPTFGTTTSTSSRIERVKKYNGSADYWWLRSAIASSSFYSVNGSGRGGGDCGPSSYTGVVFGFAINKSIS